MFKFYLNNVLVGHSRLELGDPPMGVAFGQFFPSEDFSGFSADAVPSLDGAGKAISDMRQWTGLEALAQDGEAIDCIAGGVSLVECDLGDEVQFEVTCILNSRSQYEKYFAHHIEAYENQFKDDVDG